MAAAPEILLLLDEESRSREMVTSGGGAAARLRVLRWDRVRGEDLASPDLRAVVFEDGASPDRRRRAALLKEVPDHVARVSLTAQGSRGGARRATASDLRLAPPVDLGTLSHLVSLQSRCFDMEEASRRSRRVAGQLSRQIHTVAEVLRACNAESEPQRIAEAAVALVRRHCPAEAWSVLLLDAEKSCLIIEAAVGPGMADWLGRRVGVGEGAAGRALRSRQPLSLPRGPAACPEIPVELAWTQVLAVPLLSRGKPIGVAELVRTASGNPFRRRDARVVSLLLEPMAVALENNQLLRHSQELSVTDDLTKLYNSRYMNASLSREVQRARRYRSQVSLIFLDLDGFKNVNDQHGHLAGSRALVEVGAVIRHMVREIDIVCRFGGDEFTVILPQTGSEGARVIAERIRQRLEETVFLETFSLAVRITASFGVATFPDHALSEKSLIQKADEAMYRVKGHGKNAIAEALTEV